MAESATAKAVPQAEVYFSKQGDVPTVEILVPHGTTFAQVASLHDVISKEAIAKISPRGCAQCTSGVHLVIREKLEEMIRVELPRVAVR
jgi:hypothetical protein